jgi:hypothetical protein
MKVQTVLCEGAVHHLGIGSNIDDWVVVFIVPSEMIEEMPPQFA